MDDARTGRFIVLEGIDGAGTTTQAARLVDRLRNETTAPVRVDARAERRADRLARASGAHRRIVAPEGRAPGWATMALLFAADRMDHVESEIEPFLATGGVVDLRSLRRVEPRVPERVERPRRREGGRVDPRAEPARDAARPHDRARSRRRDRGRAGASRAARRRSSTSRTRCSARSRCSTAISRSTCPNDRVVVIDGRGPIEEVERRMYAAYLARFP